ncbi:MFS transporter [Pseudomonas shahriarae]|uniref:MFS transporter n=1 Tax=Pseudomonas shahriarae TaxID=2745512 RepID=UPI0020768527|nr:MFS transporter [Pseudomonas shahriarae]MCM8560803.1 MFS transporter [Pseudomonas shahriarae]
MYKYLKFVSLNWKGLLFGATLMATSSFGQTYFVALYSGSFRGFFSLSDGELGAIYAVATLFSALTLPWVGRLIDRVSLFRYTLFVAMGLVLASLVTAFSVGIITLGIGFYLLRLSGQGLMVHTAMTATARKFPFDAGKALGVIALGLALAQALMPLAAVGLIGAIGWRLAWVVNALTVTAIIAFALRLLPTTISIEKKYSDRITAPPTALRLWRDPRILLTLPIILASPFITTGFFFHQARLSEEMNWSIAWIAGWFIAYALTQALSLIISGPMLDRYGPVRILPFFMAPQGIAMVALYLSSSIWVAPLYLILTGVSSAVASTLSTALWMQLYGQEQLGRIRSLVGAWSVVASGASPVIMGILIDQGITLRFQSLGCLAFIFIASLLSTKAGLLGRENHPS